MLTLASLAKRFGTRTLFAEAAFTILRGDRFGLVGANGAGKTTLFRIILGEDSADDGTLTWQRGTTVGFLPQESTPAGDETILQLATSPAAVGPRAREEAADRPRRGSLSNPRGRIIRSSHAPNRSSPASGFARATITGPPARSPAAGSCAPTSRACSSNHRTC